MRHLFCRANFYFWLTVPLLCAIVGCAGKAFTPHNLPRELQAFPVADINTIDLTKLSGYTVSSELIEPGDVLEVSLVSGYADRGAVTTPVRVSDNGNANIPLVGMVAVAGLELEGAEQAIRAAAIGRGIYTNPHVIVVMEQKRVNKITVIGAVNKPGVYELPRASSDMLAALVAAGGLSDDAGTEVELRSPARPATRAADRDLVAGVAPQPVGYAQQPQFEPARSVRIDLVAASRSGQGGVPLRDGDVLMVTKRDPKPIHVIGLVRKPGQYEMPPNKNLHVLDAIAMAGGIDSSVADKIYVIRRQAADMDAAMIQVSLQDAKRDGTENLRLASGDIVSVEQTLPTVAVDAIKSVIRIGVAARVPLF